MRKTRKRRAGEVQLRCARVEHRDGVDVTVVGECAARECVALLHIAAHRTDDVQRVDR